MIPSFALLYETRHGLGKRSVKGPDSLNMEMPPARSSAPRPGIPSRAASGSGERKRDQILSNWVEGDWVKRDSREAREDEDRSYQAGVLSGVACSSSLVNRSLKGRVDCGTDWSWLSWSWLGRGLSER